MRLLDTSSYELTEFQGDNIPPYVILSHTWGDDEVLFPDIQNKTAQSKKGFNKLVGCCKKAVEDGFKWVWIDTCCIDKSSSTELSEAINSMYRWYRDSTICYAYLEDMTNVFRIPGRSSKQFTESRWFTRGWTLQELIAPRAVEFYTSTWEEIGTKRCLDDQIAAATGIPDCILRGEDVSTRTVAERMSWASKRQTTRREDRAYCLMGLFQINMPLLYGEGDKAFMRLQEQILGQDEDYSILAWTPEKSYVPVVLMGCLASSPSQFGTVVPETRPMSNEFGELVRKQWSCVTFTYDDLVRFTSKKEYRALKTKNYDRFRKAEFDQNITMPKSPPQLTARGLRISLPARRINFPLESDSEVSHFKLAWIYNEVDDRLVCVLLFPSVTGPIGTFARLPLPWLISVDKSLLSEFELTEFFILPSGFVGRPTVNKQVSQDSRVRLELSPAPGYDILVVEGYPDDRWNQNDFHLNGEYIDCGVLLIQCISCKRNTATRFQVICGMLDHNPWCLVKEVPWPGRGNEEEDQRRRLEDLKATFIRFEGLRRTLVGGQDAVRGWLSIIADRAVKSSINIPGMVVSVAIRKRPSNEEGMSQFSLRITLGKLANCDSWVQVHAGQRTAGAKERVGDVLMGGVASQGGQGKRKAKPGASSR